MHAAAHHVEIRPNSAGTIKLLPRSPLPWGSVPAYSPLERLAIARPVDRIGYLREQCRGRVVVDIGAMDETAMLVKRGKGTWLHEEIACVAKEVIGVDSSSTVPDDGLDTASNARIHRVGAGELGKLLDRLGVHPDTVIAGEVIEHVEDALGFLTQLRREPTLAGSRLYLSTPNATALHNGLIAIAGRESTHHDHLAIHSYKTLTTLLSRAGFVRWRIVPYRARFTEMLARNSGWRRALVSAGQTGINMGEALFPLLSFGYIVEAEL